METTIYRKSTNNGVYIHWDSFAPKNWKGCALHSILTRTYKIWSIKELMKNLNAPKENLLKLTYTQNG